MTINIFDTQIAARRENDARLFEQALEGLASILDPQSQSRRAAELKGAIAEIVAHLGGSMPELPADLIEENAQLEYLLRPSGIMCRRVNLVGSWWKDAVGCMLGSTGAGQVVAIMPAKGIGYTYRNTEGRLVKVDRRAAKNLSSDAFCFYRPLPAKKLSISDLLRFMLQSVTFSDFLFVLGAGASVSILGLFLPFMNKLLFDVVVPGGMKSMLAPVAVLLIGVALGSALFGMTRGIILTRLQNKINLAVQSAAMMRLLSLPAIFFREYSAGELSSRLMSIHALCGTLSNAVLTVGLTALFSLVYLAQMAGFAPSLLLPAVSILLASMGLSVCATLIQLRVSRKRMKISARLNGLLFALVSGIQKIKLAGAEKRAFAQWATVYEGEGKLTYAPPFFLRVHSAIAALVSSGGALWLYFRAGTAGISPADYMAFQVAYGAVSAAVLALAGVAASVAGIKPILEMVQPILETVPETSSAKKIVTSLSGHIEINNLTFRYDKDGPAILDNFHLKLQCGEYVSVVGKTGCGKSTLMRLLLGFEKPESGAIYYDGHDLDHLDLRSVRRCIGVNLQNSKLFPGDIFANIILTAPWKTMDDAWEAARLAGIDEDIKAMPMGMFTVISEGTGGISGGQRQRLLIARAIVSKPNILFFDEATSALDNLTQKRIVDSIDSLQCTRLIIAHRLSTIRHSDRIIVIDGGRIVEEGNYETLMAQKGHFYELAARQTL